MTEVQLSSVTLDRRLQIRVSGVNPDTVEEYREAMENGDEFPAVELFRVNDELFLVDGWHRFKATQSLGRSTVRATVMDGTWEDALEHVRFKVNRKNGQRLTRADKQALCEAILTEERYKGLSDRELARLAGVSHPVVASTRKRLGQEKPEFSVGADGKLRSTGKVSSSFPELHTSPPTPTLPWKTEAEADKALAEKVSERLKEHLRDLRGTIDVLTRTEIVIPCQEDLMSIVDTLTIIMMRSHQ